MGRAQGKHTPRIVADLEQVLGVTPEGQTEGERREEGIGDPRDIPGGRNHRGNPPVPRFAVPGKPHEYPYRRADLAHGVPPDEAGHYDRDPRLSGAHAGHVKPGQAPHRPPDPVPVYIVQEAGGPGKVRSAAPRSITCPASTSAEPVRVCGLNPARVKIMLLNEDTATDIRFGTDLAVLAAGVGALLPWPANTYTTLETQGELWAIGATGAGTPRLSIIEITEDSAAA